jgi:hypothetical protein
MIEARPAGPGLARPRLSEPRLAERLLGAAVRLLRRSVRFLPAPDRFGAAPAAGVLPAPGRLGRLRCGRGLISGRLAVLPRPRRPPRGRRIRRPAAPRPLVILPGIILSREFLALVIRPGILLLSAVTGIPRPG